MSHSHTSEILYRLFAPLMAVFVIVGGIQLTAIALGGESQIGAPALVPMPMKKPADNRVSLPAKRPALEGRDKLTSKEIALTSQNNKKITIGLIDTIRDVRTGGNQESKGFSFKKGKDTFILKFKPRKTTSKDSIVHMEILSRVLNKKGENTPEQETYIIRCQSDTIALYSISAESQINKSTQKDKQLIRGSLSAFKVKKTENKKPSLKDSPTQRILLKSGEKTEKTYSGYRFLCGKQKTNKELASAYLKGSTKDPECDSKTSVIKGGKCVTKEAPKPKETKKRDPCTSFSVKDKGSRPKHCEAQAPKPLKKDLVKDCIKDGGKVVKNSKGIFACSFTKVIKGPPKKLTPQQVCERNNAIYRGINRQTGKVICQPRSGQQPPQRKVTVQEKCESIGGIYKGVNPQTGRHVCVPRQGGASAASSKEKALAAQLKKSQAARKADNARANAALKKQAAQARAAQQRAKQQAQKKQSQRPPQQRPPQKRPQESKGAFDKILAYLKGKIKREEGPVFGDITAKPQCLSFTADNLSIAAGDKVTLQWAVTGADKIIITPKVKIVEKDGKKVAEAHPESSIKKTLSDGRTVGYLLISTNNKGEEHRCYTKPIIVDNDTDPEGSVQCEGAIDSLSIKTDPRSVTRPVCDPEQSGEECNNDWQGKEITINWNVTPTQCVTSCKVQLKADGEADWLDVWTTPADMKNTVDSALDGFSNNGLLRETSTFKLKCEDGFGNLKEKSIEAEVLIDGRIEA